MSVTYVRGDALRAVHAHLIRTYGGLPGIRDEGGLESAMARPQQLSTCAGDVRVGALAACLGWAILRNHPFADGNKRVALAALVMFAKLNKHRIVCDEPEETAMVLKAAAGYLTEEVWTAWTLKVMKPGVRV